MSPFEPIGERARWRVIYDQLAAANIGDMVTYAQLAEELGLDPVLDRTSIQLAARRAMQELLEVNRRAVDAIPNIGYRIVDVSAQLQLAQRRQRRARRQVVEGNSLTINVDANVATHEERNLARMMGEAFGRQIAFMRRLDVGQRELEKRLDDERQERLRAEEMTRQRLAALEHAVGVRQADDAAP